MSPSLVSNERKTQGYVSKPYLILQKTRILIPPCTKKFDPNPSLFSAVHNTIPKIKKNVMKNDQFYS